MTENTWPDPARPGVPLNPEKDGWHWLQESDLDPECAFWRAQPWFGDKQGKWETTGTEDDFAPYEVSTWRYFGPALTPDEAAALQKRAAELEAALQKIANSTGFCEACECWRKLRNKASAALEGGKDE